MCVEEGVQRGMQMKNPYGVQNGCSLYSVYTKTFVPNAMYNQGGQGAVLGVELAIINVEVCNTFEVVTEWCTDAQKRVIL